MSDSQQNADRAPTGTEESADLTVSVDVAEAARRLGVTPDAILSRLQGGTLDGEKVDGQWRVRLPTIMLGSAAARNRQDIPGDPTGTQQDTDSQPTRQNADRQGIGDGTDRTRQDASTVDIAPLAETIDRLSQRNEELSAAVGMWQARAMHLEDQVKHLTASAESTNPPPSQIRTPWWRRLQEHPASTLTNLTASGSTLVAWGLAATTVIAGLMTKDTVITILSAVSLVIGITVGILSHRVEEAIQASDWPRVRKMKITALSLIVASFITMTTVMILLPRG